MKVCDGLKFEPILICRESSNLDFRHFREQLTVLTEDRLIIKETSVTLHSDDAKASKNIQQTACERMISDADIVRQIQEFLSEIRGFCLNLYDWPSRINEHRIPHYSIYSRDFDVAIIGGSSGVEAYWKKLWRLISLIIASAQAGSNENSGSREAERWIASDIIEKRLESWENEMPISAGLDALIEYVLSGDQRDLNLLFPQGYRLVEKWLGRDVIPIFAEDKYSKDQLVALIKGMHLMRCASGDCSDSASQISFYLKEFAKRYPADAPALMAWVEDSRYRNQGRG